MIRAVARITISSGQGRGAALGIVRLRPSRGSGRSCVPHCRISSIRKSSTASSPCICSKATRTCHGRSPTIPSAPNPGAGDWFVLIDATHVDAVPAAAARFTGNAALNQLVISSGVYSLMWDLARRATSRR